MNEPRVALLIETSTSWGAKIAQGVANFAQRHGPWLFDFEPRGRYEKLRLPRGWAGDGIVARVTSRALAEQIVALGVPAVNVSWFDYGDGEIPRCTTNEDAGGRLALEHFRERGLVQFAYCGPTDRPGYVDRFGSGFAEAVRAVGADLHVYTPRRERCERVTFEHQLAHLCAWLGSLPKPIGLLAWSDIRGRQITEACRYASIPVPGDIAVLGGEEDELMGRISVPPLSTIDPAPVRVGFEAAQLLSRLMAGEPAVETSIRIEPKGIVPRQSTDVLAVRDPEVAAALRFIHDSAADGIRVDDVLDRVSLSRRMLERRFRQALGRTPAGEIRRVRLARARDFLAQTDRPVAEVARICGFAQPEVFVRAFRQAHDLSPSEFRRRARVGG